MLGNSWLRSTLTIGLCAMLVGQPALAAETHSPVRVPTVLDIELGAEGTLVGRVVDRQGIVQRDATVTVASEKGEALQVKTDRQGRFAVRGLRGGEYRLVADKQFVQTRLWRHATAPPHAKRQALVVIGAAVRGVECDCDDCVPPGHFDGFLLRALRNPWIIGGLTAAAIAIPLATDSDDAS